MAHYADMPDRQPNSKRRIITVGIMLALVALVIGIVLKTSSGDAKSSAAPPVQSSAAAQAPASATASAATVAPTTPSAKAKPTPSNTLALNPSSIVTAKPYGTSTVYVTPTPGKPYQTNAAGNPYKLATYVVQKGDTLTKIARWFQYDNYEQLFNQNISKINDPNLIFPGQTITIWSTGGMTLGD